MKTIKFTFNKLSLVLLFVIYSASLFSQINVYKPFPTLIGTWVTQIFGPTGPNYPYNAYYSWNRYEVNGDTTIGNYTYKKVTVASSIGNPVPGQTILYGSSSYSFAYRNDILNKRVYIYTNITGQYKDTLWYDFNLSIGDTLKSSLSTNFSNSNPRTIVTSIDSVFICGEYYKKFNFAGCSWPNLDLIEGVGFTDHFIQTTPMCPFEPVYLYSTGFTCSSASVNEETLVQINIFPNPVESILQINFLNKNMIFPLSYSIVDCIGKVVFSGTTTENKSIDVSKIKNGLYFILLKDRQNNLYQSKFVKE